MNVKEKEALSTPLENRPEKRCPTRKMLAIIVAGLVMSSLLTGSLCYIIGTQAGIQYEVESYIIISPNTNATLRIQFKDFHTTATTSGENWIWVSIETSNKLDVNATIRALAGEQWVYGNWTIYIMRKRHASDPYTYYSTLRTGFANITETASTFNQRLTPGKGYYKVYLVFNATQW